MNNQHKEYFNYLSRRSRLGYWYRRYWLYPAISRQLCGHVLDVGCGIGDLLCFRPDTVGVDINPATIAYCRKLGLDARLMEADRLPFDADEFDGVNLDNVLEHIAKPMPLLAEIRRVLRPGGTVIVGVPGSKGFALDPDHKVYYDESLLRKTVTQAGFQWRRKLTMPLPINILETRMRAFCLYGVFTRADG